MYNSYIEISQTTNKNISHKWTSDRSFSNSNSTLDPRICHRHYGKVLEMVSDFQSYIQPGCQQSSCEQKSSDTNFFPVPMFRWSSNWYWKKYGEERNHILLYIACSCNTASWMTVEAFRFTKTSAGPDSWGSTSSKRAWTERKKSEKASSKHQQTMEAPTKIKRSNETTNRTLIAHCDS